MDNCGTSRKYLYGKVGSPSSFDLTIGIASLIVCQEFLSQGYFKICDFVDEILTIDDMVIVETYKRSYYLGKELGSIIHHTANA